MHGDACSRHSYAACMDGVELEFTGRAPDARLSGLVLRYQGFSMDMGEPVRRREVPGTTLPLVIAFEGGFGLGRPGEAEGPVEHFESFTGGPQEAFVPTYWPAKVRGLQVDLTLLGAHLFLGMPLEALRGRTAHLEEVLGRTAARMRERLRDAPDWASRFALLDEAFLTRVTAARAPARELTWAWRRIHGSGGNLDIGGLAAELGCSRPYLTQRFRQTFGIPPKTLARVRRFERAVRLLEEGGLPPARIAHLGGYCDQAHFNREFKRLAGTSPGRHLMLRADEPSQDT